MNPIKKLILKVMASSLKVKLGSVVAVAVIGGGITTGVVYHNQNNASPQKQVSNVVKEKVTSEGNDKKETVSTNTPDKSTENVDSNKEQAATTTNAAADTTKTNDAKASNDGAKNNSSSSDSNKSDKNASTATSATPSKNTSTSTSTNANNSPTPSKNTNTSTSTNANTNNSPTPSSTSNNTTSNTSNTASNTPTPAPKPSYNEADNITSSPYQPDGDKPRILDGVSKYNKITINGTPVSILNSVAGYLTCDFQRTVPVKNALTGKVLCGKYKITRLDFTGTRENSMDMDLADRCIAGNELHTSLNSKTVSGSLVYSAYFAYITDSTGTVNLGRLMVELSAV